MSNIFTITVEFDKDAWDSMGKDEREKVLDELQDSVSDHAYISSFEAL